MSRVLRVVTIAWIAVTAASTVFAQRLPMTMYTEREGLPSSGVRGIAQSDDGRIWVATRNGLAVYDGVGWATITPPAERDESLSFVRAGGGEIWTATHRSYPQQVRHWDGDRWYTLPPLPEPVRSDEFADFVVGRHKGHEIAAASFERGGLVLWDGTEWQTLLPYPRHEVRVVRLAWHEGMLWVGKSDGLFHFDLKDRKLVRVSGSSRDAIYALSIDRIGRLWSVSAAGIGIVGESPTIYPRTPKEFGAGARDLSFQPLPSGDVYLGSHSELVMLSTGRPPFYMNERNGMTGDGTTAILHDREGLLWFANERGLTKLVNRAFQSMDRDLGLFDNEVTAILQRANGDIILGHRGGLTFHEEYDYRPVALPRVEEGTRNGGRVLGLAEDDDGSIWIAADDRGLMRWDSSGKIRIYKPPVAPRGLSEGAGFQRWSVTDVHRGRDGVIRVLDGTALFRVENDELVEEYRHNDEMAPLLRRIYEREDGELCLASNRGLFCRESSDDRWNSWQATETPLANDIFSFAETPDGSLWLGTSAGLYRRSGGELVRVTEPEIHRPIYFIGQDLQERTWFGTDNGVLVRDGESLTRYGAADGLAGYECNRAAFLALSNTVWIGTNLGLSVVVGALPERGQEAPSLFWTSLMVSDHELTGNDEVSISAKRDDLSARYRAVYLRDQKSVRVESRLEGFDEDWTSYPPGQQPDLRYMNLNPGRYRLHVRATAGVGGPVSELTTAWIHVLPPFWARGWFLGLVGAAILGMVLLVRVLSNQRRYAGVLENRVESADQKMLASEARYRQLFHDTKAPTMLIDPESLRIEDANHAAAHLFGLTLEEFRDSRFTDYLGDESGGLAPGRIERRLRLASGELRHVELYVSAVRLDTADRWYAILQDITDQRRIELEMQRATKLESLGILAGGIAHDFNNLLMVILGNLGLMRSSIEQADELRPARAIEGAVKRAQDLTRQLLTFSRGGAPVKETASMTELVREAAGLVLSGSAVKCAIELPEDLWSAEIDPGQINQVFDNLLLNASQAMSGGGRLLIRGSNVDIPPHPLSPGRYVRLDFVDDGPGIPAETLQRIFDPYFSTKQEGNGLGLATAYSIVRRHGGLLTVDSQPGHGASFCLYVPAAAKESRPVSRVTGPTAEVLPSVSGRILVMDDSLDIREVVQRMLLEARYRCEVVSTGEDLLKSCAELAKLGEGFDLMLVDLTIRGGMGGRETIERLRKAGDTTPAIVMSGYSNDPVMADPGSYGFRGRLPKPFLKKELLETVAQVLSRASNQ